MATTDSKITINDIRKYFGGPLKEFSDQWKQLSDADKLQIRQGFDNGTMTY